MRRDGELDPAKLKQPKGGRGREYAPEMLLENMPKRCKSIKEWQTNVAELTGMSRRTFYDLLPKVQDQTERDKRGNWRAKKA